MSSYAWASIVGAAFGVVFYLIGKLYKDYQHLSDWLGQARESLLVLRDSHDKRWGELVKLKSRVDTHLEWHELQEKQRLCVHCYCCRFNQKTVCCQCKKETT